MNFVRLICALALLMLSAAAHAQQQGPSIPLTDLPPASLPLSGAEPTYIVQGGVSKQITAGNLLAGGLNIGPVTATAATTGRTLPAYFSDFLNAKNYGALGNGTTNDLGALNATFAARTNSDAVYLPPGLYPTGLGATADNLTTFGPGRLLDSSGNRRAPYHTTIQAAPTSTNGITYNYATYYNTDWSHAIFASEAAIEGTCTLGCPTSSYMWTPETSVINLSVLNNSGWNQNTADNGGRTGYSAVRLYLTSGGGGGDTVGIDQEIQIGGAKAGATSFLANPAGSWMSGDIGALNAGVFLQGIGDMNFSDNGNDVAAIPIVFNMNRTNNTGALGAVWIGSLLHSFGSKPIDSFNDWIGASIIGVDMAGATFTNAAMTLPANAGIFFNATNTDPTKFSRYTNAGTTYILYNSSSDLMSIAVDGVGALQISGTQVIATVPVKLPPYTVASLPGCGSGLKNALVAVTDASAPTYNGALAGGGAVNIPVFCNGVSWTAH